MSNPKRTAENTQLSVAIFSFLMMSLLIAVSPFLAGVWTRSRLARGFAVTSSGLAGAAFWIFIFGQGSSDQGAGVWCLFFASTLNFLGLLLVRKAEPGGVTFATKGFDSSRIL